jgi:hypothetical protein
VAGENCGAGKRPDGIVIVEKGEVPYYAAAISHHGGPLTNTGVVEGAKRGLRSRSSPDSKGPKKISTVLRGQ